TTGRRTGTRAATRSARSTTDDTTDSRRPVSTSPAERSSFTAEPVTFRLTTAASFRTGNRNSSLTRLKFSEIRICKSFPRLRAEELTEIHRVIAKCRRVTMHRTKNTDITRKHVLDPVFERNTAARRSDSSSTANSTNDIAAHRAVSANSPEIFY